MDAARVSSACIGFDLDSERLFLGGLGALSHGAATQAKGDMAINCAISNRQDRPVRPDPNKISESKILEGGGKRRKAALWQVRPHVDGRHNVRC